MNESNRRPAASAAPLEGLPRGSRTPRCPAVRILWAALLLAVWCAGTARAQDGGAGGEEHVERPGGPESEPVSPEEFYFRSDDMVRNEDGTLTWFYVTNHVAASVLKESLDAVKLPGVSAALRKRDVFTIGYDPGRRRSREDTAKREVVVDENVLIVQMPPAYREIVREILDRFDVPEPQVYIKAKVVEVTIDSNLEYGVSLFFDRSTASTGNPGTFFRGFRTGFRPPSATAPFLSPDNTGIGLLFDDISMDEGTLVAQIEALQERGAANILSEPGIVATQGQLATLITGTETPVSEVVISGGSTERITTKFKETGIRLDFTPLHIGREYVKLRVRPEVSSITAFQEVKGPTTAVQNPIIAQRYAETVVTIRDGMTLIIGGLYSISEIEDRAGIPILGDIPVLRFLFSRTQKTKVKSELDFFITPHILRQRLQKAIFTPPMEQERLRRTKERSN